MAIMSRLASSVRSQIGRSTFAPGLTSSSPASESACLEGQSKLPTRKEVCWRVDFTVWQCVYNLRITVFCEQVSTCHQKQAMHQAHPNWTCYVGTTAGMA